MDELIQKYHTGQLSPAERKAVEKRMSSDPDFAARIDQYADLHGAIRITEAEELKTHLQELDAQQSSTTKRQLNWLRIAAVIAVLVCASTVLYMLLQAPSNDQLYSQYFEPYPNALHPISRGTTPISNRERALADYELGNYAEAENGLQQLLLDTTDVNLTFYLAMALLNEEKFNEALGHLQSIQHAEGPFAAPTKWYLALIIIKQGENERAIPLLRTLAESETKYQRKAAQELLNRLK